MTLAGRTKYEPRMDDRAYGKVVTISLTLYSSRSRSQSDTLIFSKVFIGRLTVFVAGRKNSMNMAQSWDGMLGSGELM